ncbi:MAG: WD40 repeat domain-containing protein [Planktothrix sp.]|uniref:WD40 repeat domain-containing protein n=1 Tax=Planktothrix sp. TaxID=3088171 RepID=UPI0038D4742C
MLKPTYKTTSLAFKITAISTAIGLSGLILVLGKNANSGDTHVGLNTSHYTTLQKSSAWEFAIAISDDGKTLISADYDGKINIFDLQNRILIKTINAHSDAIESLAINSKQKVFVSGSWDNQIKLWDLKNGNLIRSIKGHLDSVKSVDISSDGKILASGSWDKTVKLWDVESGKEIQTFNHDHPFRAVAISPDQQFIAGSTEDGKIFIWQIKTGELKFSLAAHRKAVRAIAFSPDGKTLASGGYDGIIKLWNLQNGQLIHQRIGHNNAIFSVVFSSDGKTLATSSYDKTIKLWNVENGQLINTLLGHNKAVWSVAFTLQDNKLVSASSDQTVKIWQLPKEINSKLLPTVDDLGILLIKHPEITHYPNLDFLNQNVYEQINQAWLNRNLSNQDFVYRVGVSTDGKILAYQLINSQPRVNFIQNPLSQVISKLVTRKVSLNEPMIHFKVVFTHKGILEVSPWHGY